jgi:hypothetical protein
MHSAINIPGKRNLILMASASLCVGGIAAIGGPVLAVGLIGVICLTVMSIINKGLFFQLIWWWIAFSGIIINSLGIAKNTGIQHIDQFFVGVMIIHLIMHLKRVPARDFPIVGAGFMLVFIAVLSTVLNGSPGSALIGFLSSHIRIFIFLICAQCLLTEGELKGVISAVFYTGVIQFIIAVVQFSTFGNYNLFVGSEITIIEDAACGTFGYYGAHTLGHLMIILLILSSSLALYTKQTKYLLLTIVFIATFILTFTEIDYVFLFGYLCVFFYKKEFKTRYRIMISVLLTISVVVFVNYQTSSRDRFYQYLTDKQRIVDMGKVQSLYTMKDFLLRDAANLAIGVGPGTSYSLSAFKYRGEYFKKYVEDRSGEIKSTLDYRWSSFMAIIAETGLFSCLVYIFLFSYLFRRAVLIIRHKGQDPYNKGIASAYLFILIFFTYTTFWLNSLEMMEFTYPIAIVTAYILKVGQDSEASRSGVNRNI